MLLCIRGVMCFFSVRHDQKKKKKKFWGRQRGGGGDIYGEKETGLMMSRGTYLRSTVSFWASSSQLRRRVLNSDAACLSAPAATGGNALINTDCPSLTAGRSVSLMILGAPALFLSSPRSPLINVWVTVVFPYWYLDWWRRSRNKPYWPDTKWYVSNCLEDVFMHNGRNEC